MTSVTIEIKRIHMIQMRRLIAWGNIVTRTAPSRIFNNIGMKEGAMTIVALRTVVINCIDLVISGVVASGAGKRIGSFP
jgi:hypothetical protein